MATTKKSKSKPATTPSSDTIRENRARMALSTSTNAAAVIHSYQGNIAGKDTDMQLLVDGLRDTFNEVKTGNLSGLEAMLISQATALQTIFTSLARRAAAQEHLRQYEAFLGLALKAQAQSRATLSALVDLKYPRQATFVKQANIAHGPQQVNNGAAPDGFSHQYAQAHAHTGKNINQQNELLEVQHGSETVDTRTTGATNGKDKAMATVG